MKVITATATIGDQQITIDAEYEEDVINDMEEDELLCDLLFIMIESGELQIAHSKPIDISPHSSNKIH